MPKKDVISFDKWQPTRLDGDHMHMLHMHLAGFSNKEIAEEMGCTPQHVSNVVTSDLGRAFIQDRINGLDAEFYGLYDKAIHAIRRGLDDSDTTIALSAADKWLRAHGKYAKSDGERKPVSAEDIVQKLLERGAVQQVNISDSNVIVGTPANPASTNSPPDVQARPSLEPPHPFREVVND